MCPRDRRSRRAQSATVISVVMVGGLRDGGWEGLTPAAMSKASLKRWEPRLLLSDEARWGPQRPLAAVWFLKRLLLRWESLLTVSLRELVIKDIMNNFLRKRDRRDVKEIFCKTLEKHRPH